MSARLFRWAPTPSGPLHLGNILSFLYTTLLARQVGAELLLRIDDLDATRARPEYVDEIFLVLSTLGLQWQRGPRNAADFRAHHSQRLSQGFYASEFAKARALSPERYFVCLCTRSQIQAASPGGLYPGTCRELGLEWEPGRSWRARVAASETLHWNDEVLGLCSVVLAEALGDFVVFRKEELFAYQWVSLCEDLRTGVTDIVRGEDLRTSTAAQLYLGAGTSFATGRFWHHPLLWQGDEKLSKSEGAPAVMPILQTAGGVARIYRACARWMELDAAESIQCYDDLERAFRRRSESGGIHFGARTQFNELL